METLAHLCFRSSTVQSDKIVFTTVNGKTNSYLELHQEWTALKNKLVHQGLLTQKRIGILCSSKPQSLIGIGAVLLSQNVYVPLDHQAPIARNIQIIKTNCLHALLIETALYERYKEHLPKHQIDKREGIYLLCFEQVETVKDVPLNLAYILNTSGSTGQPKGVMITHQNALHFINWASNRFSFHSSDVFASIAPFHFDLSIFDLYVSIKHGASLMFFEPDEIKNPRLLAQQIANKGVTVIYATPTILRLLLQYGKLHKYDFHQLRYVLFAGEVFPIEDLKRLKAIWSQAEFYNLYGPTETNVCTYFQIPEEIEAQTQPFPIGKACIPKTTKIGKDGELLVTGSLVTPGYWNNENQNKAVFEQDENGEIWYKTGDLVRLDEAGHYIFMGRKDRMVKRRGYRIELDEIEHLVRNYEPIQAAGIVAVNVQGEVRINCYYVLKTTEETEKISAKEIRAFLLEYIPLYMLPDQYFLLKKLPQTSTQKIDYQTLINQSK